MERSTETFGKSLAQIRRLESIAEACCSQEGPVAQSKNSPRACTGCQSRGQYPKVDRNSDSISEEQRKLGPQENEVLVAKSHQCTT